MTIFLKRRPTRVTLYLSSATLSLPNRLYTSDGRVLSRFLRNIRYSSLDNISIGKLENLTSYTFCSTFRATISAEFFQIVVHVLVKCKNLRDIRLDFNVYSYHVPVIRLLGNLSAITFSRPSRPVLTQIGPWIEEFTQPLENFSIIVNLPPSFVRWPIIHFVERNESGARNNRTLNFNLQLSQAVLLKRGHKLS